MGIGTAAILAGVTLVMGGLVGYGVAKLAQGGIVMPTAGGTPAIIGEGGRPEAVIPLHSLVEEQWITIKWQKQWQKLK